MDYPTVEEIAERMHALREMCGYTQEEMAQAAEVDVEEYKAYERGERDFSFMFLYRCAEKLEVDLMEIMTGKNPHLTDFAVVRQGDGLLMRAHEGFDFYHLATKFKNKIAQPFLVKAEYHPEEQDKPIPLGSHEGQEFDFILSGSLRFNQEGRIVDLEAGDSIYYDSGKKHGMIATSEEGCIFLAIVMKRDIQK